MAILGNNNHWAQGHCDPWWGKLHQGLTYINEPFNDATALAEWYQLGYSPATQFTGDMYDMRNPEPSWIAPFRAHFGFEHFSWSVYRMNPGTVLPEHQDTYSRFRQIYKLDPGQPVARAIVFLEDWQSGHYLEMNGKPVVDWQAGDWVCWEGNFPHAAANVGKTPRYTLQITGV